MDAFKASTLREPAICPGDAPIGCNLKCSVCKLKVANNQAIRCFHGFCETCIRDRLQTERGCPICGEPVVGLISSYYGSQPEEVRFADMGLTPRGGEWTQGAVPIEAQPIGETENEPPAAGALTPDVIQRKRRKGRTRERKSDRKREQRSERRSGANGQLKHRRRRGIKWGKWGKWVTSRGPTGLLRRRRRRHRLPTLLASRSSVSGVGRLSASRTRRHRRRRRKSRAALIHSKYPSIVLRTSRIPSGLALLPEVMDDLLGEHTPLPEMGVNSEQH